MYHRTGANEATFLLPRQHGSQLRSLAFSAWESGPYDGSLAGKFLAGMMGPWLLRRPPPPHFSISTSDISLLYVSPVKKRARGQKTSRMLSKQSTRYRTAKIHNSMPITDRGHSDASSPVLLDLKTVSINVSWR